VSPRRPRLSETRRCRPQYFISRGPRDAQWARGGSSRVLCADAVWSTRCLIYRSSNL